MDRRELIKQIALLTGTAVIGGEFFLTGCKNSDRTMAGTFDEEDVSLFDEVAETILPKTNTPGAKDAAVGRFMATYASDCYDDAQLQALKEGIKKLNETSRSKYGSAFVKLTNAQKQELLAEVDTEAKTYDEKNDNSGKNGVPHYFTLMKQMVLLGFFTSKPGVTQVLRWIPVPGKYLGCVEYKDGETSWV